MLKLHTYEKTNISSQQEPYRISLFGKTRQQIDVVDAEFLPYEKHLYIVVADGDENLQVLEYDNEGMFKLERIP